MKRLVLGVVAVICLVAVLAVIIISNLDVNRYKDKIQQAVFDKTGRQLQIDGEINASFFPWIGLQLNDVALANAEGFKSGPFAVVRASDVKLELLPLISGTLNVSLIELHGLQLNLQVDQDGVANWEDLLDTTTVVETETGEDDVLQSVETGAPLAAALSVGGIVVTDSSISWQDEKNASDLKLGEFNLTTDAIKLNHPFDFTADFTLDSRSLDLSSTVAVSGALALDLASNSYSLSGLDLTTSSAGSLFPVEQFEASVAGDLRMNLKAQTLDLTDMAAIVAGVPVSGEIHATRLLQSPGFFGDIASGAFDAEAVLSSIGAALPEDFNKDLLANSAFDLAFQQSEEQILVNRLEVSIGDIKLSGDMQVSNLAESAVISGQVSSNVFNPAPWFASFGVVSADPLVLQSASAQVSVRQSGQLLALNDLRVTIDGFDLQGHVELTDIYRSVPPVVFELHGTALDIDRYLPAKDLSEPAAERVVNSKLSAEEINDLPIDLLQNLNINGELSFDQLIYAGITLSDIVVPIRTEERKFEISEARAALYDGSVFSSLTLDVNSEEPLLTVTSNISAVQSAPLLADYLKTDPPISGTGILNLDMLTRGNSLDQWLEQAIGAVSVRFTDGAINGLNIAREVRRANALISGAQLSAQEEVIKTDFTELSVSGEVNEGVLRSDDLSIKSPLLRVTGQGSIDLAAQLVDYVANVLVAGTTQGQGAEDIKALEGLSLPVPVKGTFNDLSVDFTGTLIDALRSDFANRLKARKDAVLATQKEKAEAALKVQEQALKEEVQQQTEKARAILDEKKEVVIEQVEEKTQALGQQLKDKQQSIEEDLQNKLQKGISDLLDK